MTDAEEDKFEVFIKWKGQVFTFVCTPDDTLGTLKMMIEAETNVLPEKQKLSVRFQPKPSDPEEAPLSTLVLPKNRTLLMVGTPEDMCFVTLSAEEQKRLLPPEASMSAQVTGDARSPVNLAKIEKRKQSYPLELLNAPREGKKLLVLDIDYTLFDHRSGSAEHPLELMRPYLHEFLTAAYEHYDIIIWSATSYKYVHLKMTELGVLSHSDYKVVALFDIRAMITVKSEDYGLVNVKPLAVVWSFFPDKYDATNTIMFDDIRRNFLMNPQNGLRIRAYRNAPQNRGTDRELLDLKEYLLRIAPLTSFVDLDHKNWRKYR